MHGLLGLYLPTLVLSFGQGMIFPAVVALAARFHVSPGLAAQVVSAQFAGRMVAMLPAGVLADRRGPQAVLLVGSACALAGPVLMLLPAFWAVVAGQFVMGAGAGLWVAGRELSGLHLVRADQRGRLMSGFFGLQMVGQAAGPVGGGLLVDAAGLVALFAALGALGGLVLAMTLLLALPAAVPAAQAASAPAPPSDHLPAGPSDRTRAGPSGVGVALRAPAWGLGGWRAIAPGYLTTFAIIVATTWTMSLYRSSLNTLLPLYAGAGLGFSAAQVGALFGLMSLGVLVMIVPAGLVLDRLGRKWAAVPAAALPALAFTLMPLARSGPQLSLLAVALGVANGVSLGSLSTYSYDVIPAHARGTLQAQRRIVGDLGSLAGPVSGGLLVHACGAQCAFLAYVPLLTGTALALAFGARETLERVSAPARPGPGRTRARPPGRSPHRSPGA
ncbi:MAG: MFS transporter [Armatimonadota bacterium]|nr:MFS transporter [Armatimonadota bacterium]MDR7534457.1 MFS transporter [Armatimonadota bacterium]MDR7535745.1 MFS transporter [Armatimonadota bacterium]